MIINVHIKSYMIIFKNLLTYPSIYDHIGLRMRHIYAISDREDYIGL